ncbi:MAG: oligopeptidase B [Saprospiraceae bacterium]|jgi:oligopeptidase B
MKVPGCNKRYKELNVHEHTRIDPYYWLNERENPEVIDYLNRENSYSEHCMKGTEGLQEELYNEIVGRLDKTEESVPYLLDGYYYYNRFEEGKEYPLFCRKKGSLDNDEELLLNNNVLATGKDYCNVAKLSVNPVSEIIAYSVDFVSRRLYTICFKNMNTGELLNDEISNSSGGFTWSNDGKYLFYVQKDETTLRSNKVFRHELGTSSKEDIMVFHEKQEAFISSVYKCKSKQFIFIGSYSSTSTEYNFIDANDSLSDFSMFQKREDDHEYSVDHFEDKFYIVSNWEAKNFRLLTCDLDKTSKENWGESVGHREDTLLEGIEIFKAFMVLEERRAGLSQFKVISKNGEEHYIKMDAASYMAYGSVNMEFDTPLFRYGYTSLVTPSTIFDYHFEGKTQEVKKQQKIIGGYDESKYATERINATAAEGTKIPISLVYKKESFVEGQSPLLLYGYGSYGHVIDPSFSPARLSLLDRGFVFAIAHIRGGEDMGRYWYEEGKMLNKMNTFTDFISCGEHLVKQKYCAKDKLHGSGGSAGGLLIGAVMNLRPELWKSLIAAVPFVDVVTTMLDDTIPLTTGEYDEWGNPNEKKYYEYMLSYSPYDNVEAKDYPSLLVTTGLHDSQVQYFEPAKWVAKLRDLKTDDNLLLLKTNMEVGHGGASGRYEYYREVAFDFAFLLRG